MHHSGMVDSFCPPATFRDVLAVAAGDGSLGVYKYSYPDMR